MASVTVGSVAALPVGGGAGLGARRLRADAQRAGQLGDVRDRAAAGADGVHVDARDLDPELADRGLAADRRLAAWHSDTSVEVPPMSNVSTFGKPARAAT